jgi:hypothetical protein
VIGFQGRSLLEVRYGHEAEATLSQPATKVFLDLHSVRQLGRAPTDRRGLENQTRSYRKKTYLGLPI